MMTHTTESALFESALPVESALFESAVAPFESALFESAVLMGALSLDL